MSDKKLPPKLEEDLNNAKFYKPSGAKQETTAQTIAKVFDDSKERAMYDEILGPMLGAGRKPVSTAIPVAKPTAVIGGGDFNSSIIARLKQVEVDAKEARMKLAEQISINEKLREENETLRTLTTNPDTAMKETTELRRQVTQLKVKIQEMEVFLGDYGLVWVGSNPSKSYITDDIDQESHVEERETDDKTDLTQIVSFADFNRQIDELNSVIYAEPAQIIKEGNNQRKARLVQSSELLESIRIGFYKNGLMIKRGPFRYCNASNYERFVHDVMDGYFPSEFQDEYPDGVVFDLKDQHSIVYIEGKTQENFDQPQLSRAQFLNRLPKTVIHKGEVMGIRGEIADLLGNNTTDAISLVKPKVFIDSTTTSGNKTPLEDMGEMVKIQVKWIDQSTFIIHLYEKHLVDDLKIAILQHFTGEDNSVSYEFELRSAFPPRVLPWNITLKDAGLTPNGTVHARKL